MNSWKAIAACAIVAVSLAAFGCDRDKRNRESAANPPSATIPAPSLSAGTDATTAANRELSVDEFLDNWQGHVGHEVTVVGSVDKVLSPVALQLKSDRLFPHKLLVFVPKDAKIAVFDADWRGDRVRVMGPVAAMSIVDVEERVGPLSAEIRAEVEKQGPIVIARSVGQMP